MLEGKQLILATRPYAKEYRWLSWVHFLITVILLAGSFTLALSSLGLPWRIGGSVLTALLLVRMFMIYHDYLHQAIFHKSAAMKVFFSIYGCLVLAPPSIWKRSHNYHHANNSKLYTSSIGSFPIVTAEKYYSMNPAERRRYLFIRHPFTIAFGYIFAFFWGMCMLSLIRNPGRHWDSGIALAAHISAGLLLFLAFGWLSFVLAFLLPMLISGALGSYLFFAQHNFPGVTFIDKKGWTFATAAMQSSSHMQGGVIMHWITANIGYHQIHHANARIPFYRLPEVLRELPEFQGAVKTSLWPHDIASCLRLKVWDPEAKRMLSMRELHDHAAAQPA